MTQWKSIPGCSNYLISEDGVVQRVQKIGTHPHPIKQFANADGRPYVRLFGKKFIIDELLHELYEKPKIEQEKIVLKAAHYIKDANKISRFDRWGGVRIDEDLNVDEVFEFDRGAYHYTQLDHQKCNSQLLNDRAENQHYLYLMENDEGKWWLVIKPSTYFVQGRFILAFPQEKDRLKQEKIWPASPVYIPYLKKRFGFTNFNIQNL